MKLLALTQEKGCPPPIDYRDHPEKYRTGDFPPLTLTEDKLPIKTKIFYGEISDTLKLFREEMRESSKIGFVSIDVDYYSSSVDCLKVFELTEKYFLPCTPVYLDDVNNIDHNDYCGELLAINEFNSSNEKRKIAKMTQLRNWRIFKNALWLDQMYFMHALDSDYRDPKNGEGMQIAKLVNPYI